MQLGITGLSGGFVEKGGKWACILQACSNV
jgi:hypothetical protein